MDKTDRHPPVAPGKSRRLGALLAVVIGLSVGAAAYYQFVLRAKGKPAHRTWADVTQLVPGVSSTVEIPADVFAGMGMTTVNVSLAPPPAPLVLAGSLILDADRMINIHSRFPGEVVGIGTVTDTRASSVKESSGNRPLQFGDHVEKGQLLAVVWCRDVGEKKSDLVDALTRLAASTITLDRLKALPPGAVAEQVVREARRVHEADVIQVERLERTLRSWRLADEELAEVRQEAERIQKGHKEADTELERTWGEIEIRSPFAGTILEKNVVMGDIIESSSDLFKIADLSRLGAMANIYEEDLAALHSLKPSERKWAIQVQANPDDPLIHGEFNVIGKVIDVTQHSGKVLGWVDNRSGQLYIGQFINAIVQLPPSPAEVSIPESAILEDANLSRVFVVDPSHPSRFTMRRVVLLRHAKGRAVIAARPTDQQRLAGAEPLALDETVVASGVLELDSQLRDLVANDPTENRERK